MLIGVEIVVLLVVAAIVVVTEEEDQRFPHQKETTSNTR